MKWDKQVASVTLFSCRSPQSVRRENPQYVRQKPHQSVVNKYNPIWDICFIINMHYVRIRYYISEKKYWK